MKSYVTATENNKAPKLLLSKAVSQEKRSSNSLIRKALMDLIIGPKLALLQSHET